MAQEESRVKDHDLVISETESSSDEEDKEESEADELSDTEQELERLVFGDIAGFREGLKNFSLQEQETPDDEDNDRTGLDGLDDADIFFTDLTGNSQVTHAHISDPRVGVDDSLQSRHPPAWDDSDDERMLVSLANVPRLRKLRLTEDEDVVNGKEYSKRLRGQFELLNPRPTWAVTAMERPARKKRRVSRGGNESDEASIDGDMDVDDDLPSTAPLSKLLRDAESLVRQSGHGRGKTRKLRPETVDIQRMKDVGETQPSAITSLSFHPHYPLLLSSGPSSTLYLHHISPSPPAPSPNPLLTSMHVRGSPLTTTAFHPHDGRIFLSSPKKYFHVWDLNTGSVEKVSHVSGQAHEQRSMEIFKLSPDGNFVALRGTAKKDGGVVNILSATSLQWIAQARVESRNGIADFCWWRDSRGLTIVGKNGIVSEWSVEHQRVVARWQDEGAVGITTIALGGHHEFSKSPIGTDRWIAIGSSSGIVNIYDRRVWAAAVPSSPDDQPIPAQPTPKKTLDHLTTPTSNLVFSPDGQLLVMSSQWRSNALKLVHLPSCTVYKNWPTSSTPLGRVSAVAFASGEVAEGDVHSLLAVASIQGNIRMWEIR